MIQDIITPITGHIEKINNYVGWLFKKKQDFVILKQYVNKHENITKMFIVVPTRERVFTNNKVDVFNPTILNSPTFPFSDKDIKEYKTLYSGNLFDFWDIVFLLGTFKVPSKVKKWEDDTIFRDYTCTKEEQLHRYNLVDIGRVPIHSINSIFRLLHTKYITIVEIKFNNKKSYES